MADNKLELVVTVEVDKANQSIKSVNASLSGMEASATKSAKGATQGIDGMTAAMVKGATAGSLFADAIKSALAWGKEFTVGSVMMAAENAKAEASLRALATAHGVGAAAASKQVAAIEEIGFEFTEAAHAVQRLIVADMDLAKSEGLAKLAKDAAAVQNVSAGEAMEGIVLAIESGASRGLRTLGLFVDFQKKTQIAELQLGRALTETEEKQIRYNAVMQEGAKIQGAHAAASQTVEGQLGALRREFNNVREDIGAKFQEDLKSMIVNLRGLVGWLWELLIVDEPHALGAGAPDIPIKNLTEIASASSHPILVLDYQNILILWVASHESQVRLQTGTRPRMVGLALRPAADLIGKVPDCCHRLLCGTSWQIPLQNPTERIILGHVQFNIPFPLRHPQNAHERPQLIQIPPMLPERERYEL